MDKDLYKEEKLSNEKVNAVTDDLDKYGKKINAMMIDSTRGDCPQMLKSILFVKMGKFLEKNLKKLHKQAYSEGNVVIDSYLKERVDLRIRFAKNREEADKVIKDIEDNMYG